MVLQLQCGMYVVLDLHGGPSSHHDEVRWRPHKKPKFTDFSGRRSPLTPYTRSYELLLKVLPAHAQGAIFPTSKTYRPPASGGPQAAGQTQLDSCVIISGVKSRVV